MSCYVIYLLICRARNIAKGKAVAYKSMRIDKPMLEKIGRCFLTIGMPKKRLKYDQTEAARRRLEHNMGFHAIGRSG